MAQTRNNKIQRAFSASADRYDAHASLHREIADKLLAKVIKGPVPSAVLDVGCGTGYLTGRLKDQFPSSKIIGLDLAQGMLEVARRKEKSIHWVLADGNNLPFSNGCFDIVISNLAYQWAEPLSRAFFQARRVLTLKGGLACTLFGYHSCRELFQSLDEASAGALKFARLPDCSQVREALIVGGFKEPQVDCEQVKMEFNNMQELVNWFKHIGAPHLPREGYLGRACFSRASAIYQERFASKDGVYATFEVIWVYAKSQSHFYNGN
jgi:malonyl-CoA O-methyltransferase